MASHRLRRGGGPGFMDFWGSKILNSDSDLPVLIEVLASGTQVDQVATRCAVKIWKKSGAGERP